MDVVNRAYKDTLFRHIFKDGGHFADLYERCSGKRLGAGDITGFDLDSGALRRERYNDVSFITRDKRLIYLVEHNSYVSANIAVKIGAYFFDLLMLWAKREGVSIHAEKEVPFPKPELYVAYSGARPYDKRCEEYDCGEFMRIRVPVVNIRYENLDSKAPGNYLAGYAYLQHEYEGKLSEGWERVRAFEYAAQQCREKGYLKGIVEKEGFTAMISEEFSYDSQLRYEGRVEGRVEGRAEGAKAIAQRMLAEGEPVDKVAMYTGLTRAEAEGLRGAPPAGA